MVDRGETERRYRRVLARDQVELVEGCVLLTEHAEHLLTLIESGEGVRAVRLLRDKFPLLGLQGSHKLYKKIKKEWVER